MDLVTEKFKQKIAAVFYLNSRKFKHTRILRSEASIFSYLCTKKWSWLFESEDHRQVLSLFIYMKIRILMGGGFAFEMPWVKASICSNPTQFQTV